MFDLMEVAKIAAENGGVEGLLEEVATVHELAAKVNGIGALRHCLENLQELYGMKGK